MELLLYLFCAAIGIALWLFVSEVLEKRLYKKNDEVSKIKIIARKHHSYEDNNKPLTKESTVGLWKKDKIDLVTEERLRYRVKTKVKGKIDE